ncbi:MAG: hypothetical protein ACLP9L_34745 [Thermoguttaceae bacterium]
MARLSPAGAVARWAAVHFSAPDLAGNPLGHCQASVWITVVQGTQDTGLQVMVFRTDGIRSP